MEEVSCTSDHVDSLFLYCGFVVLLTAVALSQERSSRYGALSVKILQGTNDTAVEGINSGAFNPK